MKETTLKILVEECKNGDKEAREKLINYYIPYAKRIAKEYYGLGVEDEDVLMAAYEGLIIAMNKIEEHHYSNLTALINTQIELSIKREIVRNISTLGVPKETMANILIKLKQLREKITQEEITRILTDRQQNALKKEINVERLDETFMTYEKLDSINYGNIDIEHLVIHQELLKELESIILKLRLNGIEKEVILHKYILADSKDRGERIDVRGLAYKKRRNWWTMGQKIRINKIFENNQEMSKEKRAKLIETYMQSQKE